MKNNEIPNMHCKPDSEQTPRVPRNGGAVGSVEREAEFMSFIKNHANPARAKAGVGEINEDDARSVFKILENFYAQWSCKPNA